MKKITTLLLLLAATVAAFAQSEKTFNELLDENELMFSKPADFKEVAVEQKGGLYYNYAMVYEKDTFEVRYTIFSIKPLLDDYEKKVNNPNIKNVLHPNDYYKSMFVANIINVGKFSPDKMPRPVPFPPEAAKNEFGTETGAFVFFPANSGFAEGYTYCFMLQLHKKDVADVYISFLGSDKEKFQNFSQLVFHSLKFQD